MILEILLDECCFPYASASLQNNQSGIEVDLSLEISREGRIRATYDPITYLKQSFHVSGLCYKSKILFVLLKEQIITMFT